LLAHRCKFLYADAKEIEMDASTKSGDVLVLDDCGVCAATDGPGVNAPSPISAGMPDQPPGVADKIPLPSAPWRARISRGTTGRVAMELYAAGTLMDVVVATGLADEILCSARRAVWGGRSRAIAWGRLPVPAVDGPGERDLSVLFARGRHWRRGDRRRSRDHPEGVRVADVVGLAGWFWVAMADGRFDTVTVVRRGKQATRRIASVHPRPDE
jgi:hypothetical protein